MELCDSAIGIRSLIVGVPSIVMDSQLLTYFETKSQLAYCGIAIASWVVIVGDSAVAQTPLPHSLDRDLVNQTQLLVSPDDKEDRNTEDPKIAQV